MTVPAQFNLNSFRVSKLRVNLNLQQIPFTDSFSLSSCLPHPPLSFFSVVNKETLELSDVGASFKINWLMQIVSFV